jgi:putative chitinase
MSLKDFQKKIGVKPDGVFGPNTLKAAATYYNFSPERAAHFFGQVSHETGNFKIFSENLNYSARGLRTVWPRHFPTDAIAKQYERQPEKIANRAYAARMGNGPEASGDGWKFRGRGALQLTGKDNYTEFSKYLKNPNVLTTPDIVAEDLSFDSAIFFFDKNKLWAICDNGVNDRNILALTRRINGGTHGLDDREEKTKLYYNWIKK